jgi:DNA-binding NtrC family response regulator/predicted hydrocarbon binding protein
MTKPADPRFPSSRDLVDEIRFDTETGKIWFHEQRMLLTHSSLFAQLRDELIETIGMERARSLIMRLGYHSGRRDAEMARSLRPDLGAMAAFYAGPQLAAIKGMVHVNPVRIDLTPDGDDFYAEIEWKDAFEAELHLGSHGRAASPVCWMLTSYANGFSDYHFGRDTYFKEVACCATGAERCRIIGKPLEQWEDHEALRAARQPDALAEELLSLQTRLAELQETVRRDNADGDLVANSVGRSQCFLKASQLLRKAADSRVSVLLQGETGTGKELFARGLHQNSKRRARPFIAVNCACISPTLLEAELFGVEKGAYTGATSSRPGRFERANGGTLFLDEIVELTPRAQAALLRVLQEGELERVGGVETIRVDVRVVAASHENLADAVRDGRFRADLFYRLNIYPVEIPALRQRREDIPLLVEHFLQKYQAVYDKQVLSVSDKAMSALMEYAWPGNVRELENMIERGIILTDHHHHIELEALFPSPGTRPVSGDRIGAGGHLAPDADGVAGVDPLCETLLDEGLSFSGLEERLLRTALRRADGNVSKAARLLGLTRPQLAYRLDKLGL